MFTKLRRRISEHSEHFNKEFQNIRKDESKWKNIITEMKNEGINSRLDYSEEEISNLEDRVVEITQSEQQKEKNIMIQL